MRTNDIPTIALDHYTPPEQRVLTVLLDAARATLDYSFQARDETPLRDATALVTAYMADHFFTEIMVQRPELNSLSSKLTSGHVVVLLGERGTGKSTAVHALNLEYARKHPFAVEDLLNAAPSQHVELVDLAQYTDQLDLPRITAFDVAYDQLVQHTTIASTAVAARYAIYRAKHARGFELFREEANRLFAPQTDNEWHDVMLYDALIPLWHLGLESTSQRSGTIRLRELLEFLSTECSHQTILIIDNSDHLGNDIQVEITTSLFHLAQAAKCRVAPLVTVRTENFERVKRQISSTANLEPSRLRSTQLADTDFTFLQTFLQRRISVVTKLRNDLRPHFDDVLGDRLARSYDYDNLDALLKAVDTILDVFSQIVFRHTDPQYGEDNRRFVGYLRHWYNGSLRDIARGLFDFLAAILENSEPTFPLRALLDDVLRNEVHEAHAKIEKNRRLVRTMLFRHLMFCGRETSFSGGTVDDFNQIGPPPNVMILQPHAEQTKLPFYFGQLRIVQLLNTRAKAHHSSTRGDVRACLARYGISRTRADELLADLAAPRHEDDMGLVRFDKAGGSDEILQAATKIELMPAGKFLCTSLATKCEFLFWSAIYSPGAFRKLGLGVDRITHREVQDDHFRAIVASRFVREILLKSFKAEHPYFGSMRQLDEDNARGRLESYMADFGFDEGQWFLDSCTQSILGFVGDRRNSTEYADVVRVLQDVQSFSRQLDWLLSRRRNS